MGSRDLIASKSFRYGTRRLMAGDTFQASDSHARVFIAIKNAKPAREARSIPAPPKELTEKIAAPIDDVAELRTEYRRVLGKQPFNGWDADTLRDKIKAAGK